MITSMYEVKRLHGGFDGESDIQPDAGFDSSVGYYVAFHLLVIDGTSWECTDATIGAAAWKQTVDYDPQIQSVCRALTDIIPRYCDKTFATNTTSSNGISFSAGGVIDDVNDSFGGFYSADTIEIIGSKRNDELYDVISATASQIVVDGEFTLVGADEATVTIYALHFQSGLRKISTQMAVYDVFARSTGGLSSESIGSYSYTKETTSILGIGYPSDVVCGIKIYKRPKIR